MKRIGVAASKMARGSIPLYNFYVVLIAVLFSLFIFVVAGATVLFALIIIHYLGKEIMPLSFQENWTSILSVCMVSLTVVITLFTLFAILKNIKLPKWKNKRL